MKAISSFILASVFILSASFMYAQEGYDNAKTSSTGCQREKVEDSPGMEVVKIDNMTMVVPEGRKVYKADGRIVLEETDSYMARRFKEMEEHLKRIDETLEGLKKEIKETK